MKRTLFIRLTWPLTILVAFGLGHWSSRIPNESSDAGVLTLVQEPSAIGSVLDSTVSPEPPVAEENGTGDAITDVGGSQTLSKEQIDGLAVEAFRDPSELKRSLAFSKLLESLTPENALTILEAMQSYDARGNDWDLFRYAWGAVDPESALEHAMSLEGRRRRGAISDTITGWASKQPDDAMAWVDALEDEGDQRRYRSSLVSGLADHDIGMATEYVLERAEQGDERARRYLETVTREQLRNGDIRSSVAWSESLPEGELRGEAMERVADRYVSEDPEAAAAWAERYASVDYGVDMIEEVGDEWAEREPEAAVSWLQNLPDGRGKAEGMRSALDEWAERDPMAASEYLVQMEDSAAKDSAVSGFVREVVREDPQAAIAWASTIGQEELRIETLTRTARDWFRRDRASALAWLETSGLPPEAQEAVVNRRRGRR